MAVAGRHARGAGSRGEVARTACRSARTALLLFPIAFALNEYRVSSRAGRLAANVPTRELEGLAEAWDQYDGLSGHSSNIGVHPSASARWCGKPRRWPTA